ncbi:MAG: hypothetical protein H6728_15530 [Myxococcales bacterium]|nr:hypothetical protein [Myxococcales bacterium]MCB9644483.1 hypothetical protein [Myxococcales bacterium]
MSWKQRIQRIFLVISVERSWRRRFSWGVCGLLVWMLGLLTVESGCTTQRVVVRKNPTHGHQRTRKIVEPVGPPDDLEEYPAFLAATMTPNASPALQMHIYESRWAHLLPPQVRAWMPLETWEGALPEVTSPPISSCRRRIVRMARRDRGRLKVRCTRAAQSAVYRSDCAGWLRCLFSRFGIDTFVSSGYRGRSGTFSLFHFFQEYGYIHRGKPLPGDVVFWHATVDRNRNRRLDDDPITHVGIVHKIDPDGRVRILHTGYSPRPRVHEIFMYRQDPSLYKKEVGGRQRTYNSYLVKKLRRPSRRYSRRWRHTTGELFAGYGTFRVCPDKIRR